MLTEWVVKERKFVSQPGLEPGVSWLLVRHSYHWATGTLTLCMDSFRRERFYWSIPNGVLTAYTKWLLHWFASYSIQYFGTYYTELRPRKSKSVNRSVVYGYICHISSTPMPESQWLSGKSVWLVIRRPPFRVRAGTQLSFLVQQECVSFPCLLVRCPTCWEEVLHVHGEESAARSCQLSSNTCTATQYRYTCTYMLYARGRYTLCHVYYWWGFKFGAGLTICQTAKVKSLPNFPAIRDMYM